MDASEPSEEDPDVIQLTAGCEPLHKGECALATSQLLPLCCSVLP